VEKRVGPLLVLVGRMPRAVPFVVVIALLLAGLALGGAAGALLLLLLAGGLGVLLLLSWPALLPGPRALRVAVLALLVARAATFLA
jgi:hypothetical protein